jgi:hypothetical protein
MTWGGLCHIDLSCLINIDIAIIINNIINVDILNECVCFFLHGLLETGTQGRKVKPT